MNQQTTVNSPIWPPHYKLRKSKRAQRVNFKISVKHGLQVTIPYRFNAALLPEILENKKHWIIKHLQHLPLPLGEAAQAQLPDEIDCIAIQQIWQIGYCDSFGKPRLIIRPHQKLVIMGDLKQQDICRELLIEWLKGKAQLVFQTWLTELGQRTQLHFHKLTIRSQQTRWGSCSIEKNISLNYKLLFLPPELVEHILLHELCHTVYMNHGVRFWKLLAKFDARSEEHDAALRKVQQFMPQWLG